LTVLLIGIIVVQSRAIRKLSKGSEEQA
jgi:hypothetical protein